MLLGKCWIPLVVGGGCGSCMFVAVVLAVSVLECCCCCGYGDGLIC